jgi:DoxX-like family
MNVALWIVQGLLAFALLAAGAVKVVTSHEKLVPRMKWAESWPPIRVKLLGLAEALGAVGLVVPWLTGIVPGLTPIAAGCLAALMAGAVKTHRDLKESVAAPTVLLVLCLVVAGGRVVLH